LATVTAMATSLVLMLALMRLTKQPARHADTSNGDWMGARCGNANDRPAARLWAGWQGSCLLRA
jgi:hypothetical protein